MELLPVAHPEVAGGADRKRAGYIERGRGAEHHAAGIEQVYFGLGHLRAQRAVDERLLPAGDPPDDILDGRWASEGSALAAMDIELTEAMEQIVATQLADLGIDGEGGAGERAFGAQGAV